MIRKATSSASKAAGCSCSDSTFRCSRSSTFRAAAKARPAFWFPTSPFRAAMASRSRLPYHWQIGPNRDATITPHFYTSVLPAIDVKYRELNSTGAFQISGFLTYGKIDRVDPTATEPEQHSLRGYFDANGRWQLIPEWSITARFARRPTRRLPADTTSPMTIGCATSSTPSGSLPTATFRSPAGHSRDCGSTRTEANPDRPSGDRRPVQGRRDRRRQGPGPGQQPRDPSNRRAGHQRAFASVQWDLRRITPGAR